MADGGIQAWPPRQKRGRRSAENRHSRLLSTASPRSTALPVLLRGSSLQPRISRMIVRLRFLSRQRLDLLKPDEAQVSPQLRGTELPALQNLVSHTFPGAAENLNPTPSVTPKVEEASILCLRLRYLSRSDTSHKIGVTALQSPRYNLLSLQAQLHARPEISTLFIRRLPYRLYRTKASLTSADPRLCAGETIAVRDESLRTIISSHALVQGARLDVRIERLRRSTLLSSRLGATSSLPRLLFALDYSPLCRRTKYFCTLLSLPCLALQRYVSYRRRSFANL